MTTQAVNLLDRLPVGPIRVQRDDKSTYVEHDAGEVFRMIKSGIVEGVGPRSGRIDILRVTVTSEEAVKRMSEVPVERKPEESPGSIITMASREVYRERLADEIHWCWSFRRNRGAFETAAA